MADAVREFWDSQAKTHGSDSVATAPDYFYRDMEIARIIDHLGHGENVLDIGCGNGYSTRKFANARPDSFFLGMDYSESMIVSALSGGREKNVLFTVGDVREKIEVAQPFDTIISERCLINLASWEEQKRAILNMKEVLKPDGRIILVENFTEGLDCLNGLRIRFGLKSIPMRWHNKYMLLSEFFRFSDKHFELESFDNIGGMYYVISRVIYASMAQREGKQPEYGHVLNELAAKLPHISCPYSPNYLFLLRNKT